MSESILLINLNNLKGLFIEDAIQLIENCNGIVRITIDEGIAYPLEDLTYIPERVNLIINDSIVADAYRG